MQKIYKTLFLLVFLFSCRTSNNGSILPNKEDRIKSLDLQILSKQIFVFHSNKSFLHDPDAERIRQIHELIFLGILNSQMNFITRFVDNKEGLYVEWKGHWNVADITKDLLNPDGYFALYFWDRERLRIFKEDDSALTLRDILMSNDTIELEYYFDTQDNCEVKIRIPNKPQYESYFQNSVWQRKSEEWKLIRMF